MVLKAWPNLATSVRLPLTGTRRVRSPAAIAPAVSSMSSSGRNPTLTSHNPNARQPATASPVTMTSMTISECNVSVRSFNGMATTSSPANPGTVLTDTRY